MKNILLFVAILFLSGCSAGKHWSENLSPEEQLEEEVRLRALDEIRASEKKRIFREQLRIQERDKMLSSIVESLILDEGTPIQRLYNEISRIKHLQKNEFEKTADFNLRKAKEIEKLQYPKDKVFSTDITPSHTEYNADKEEWSIRVGKYEDKNQPFPSIKKNRFRIEVESERLSREYQASNAMGATTTVEDVTFYQYDFIVSNSTDLIYLRRTLSEEKIAFRVPVPIEDAKRYAYKQGLKFRLVYRIDGKLDTPSVIDSEYWHSDATMDLPIEHSDYTYLLRIRPIAIVVYITSPSPKVIHSYKFFDKGIVNVAI